MQFTQSGAREVTFIRIVDCAAGKRDLSGVPAEMARALDEHDLVWGVGKDRKDDRGQAPRRLCAFGHCG